MPSARQIAAACEGRFVIEDWHNFGVDYDRTLMAWFENFDRAWPALRPTYGARYFHTWQLVLSGAGVPGGYQAVR